jgi:hypothetical protein
MAQPAGEPNFQGQKAVVVLSSSAGVELGTAASPIVVDILAPSGAAGALTPVKTNAVASSKVIKASPGNFFGSNMSATVSGWFMLYDLTAAPADGTVTPLKVWPCSAGGAVDVSYPTPIRCATGITIVFSTTGPYTQTLSATAFISGDAV